MNTHTNAHIHKVNDRVTHSRTHRSMRLIKLFSYASPDERNCNIPVLHVGPALSQLLHPCLWSRASDPLSQMLAISSISDIKNLGYIVWWRSNALFFFFFAGSTRAPRVLFWSESWWQQEGAGGGAFDGQRSTWVRSELRALSIPWRWLRHQTKDLRELDSSSGWARALMCICVYVCVCRRERWGEENNTQKMFWHILKDFARLRVFVRLWVCSCVGVCVRLVSMSILCLFLLTNMYVGRIRRIKVTKKLERKLSRDNLYC